MQPIAFDDLSPGMDMLVLAGPNSAYAVTFDQFFCIGGRWYLVTLGGCYFPTSCIEEIRATKVKQ